MSCLIGLALIIIEISTHMKKHKQVNIGGEIFALGIIVPSSKYCLELNKREDSDEDFDKDNDKVALLNKPNEFNLQGVYVFHQYIRFGDRIKDCCRYFSYRYATKIGGLSYCKLKLGNLKIGPRGCKKPQKCKRLKIIKKYNHLLEVKVPCIK